MKHREQEFRREFWCDHVAKQAASGKSQSAYSTENGIKHQTLSSWVTRLAREARGADAPRKRGRPPKSKVDPFAKVVAETSTARLPASMRLTFPGGIALDLVPGFDVGSVARLIAAAGGRP